jgi:hypothetical protein
VATPKLKSSPVSPQMAPQGGIPAKFLSFSDSLG